jgi:hypothetical protein
VGCGNGYFVFVLHSFVNVTHLFQTNGIGNFENGHFQLLLQHESNHGIQTIMPYRLATYSRSREKVAALDYYRNELNEGTT